MIEAALIPRLCAGGDLEVVNAARRSFDNQHQDLTDRDIALIYELAADGHLLPFRHPQLSFACCAPVYVARQLGKHQVGMSWSEVSRRYKTRGITLSQPRHYRHDHSNRRQGTGPDVHPHCDQRVRDLVARHHAASLDLYDYLLTVEKITPEQARGVLPQDMDVVWTWTGSLLAWAHVYHQRTHKDA